MAYDSINVAMVKQYSANVQHMLQQRGSRLRNAVQLETGKIGEEVFFDRVDETAAQKVTSRHADSPLMDVPHERRRVSPVDYDWGKLVDNPDRLRLIMDPTSAYVESAAMAMGRAIDEEIISAAFGNSYLSTTSSTTMTGTAFGSEGGTDIYREGAYSSGAWVAGDNTGTAVGLTVDKLIRARKVLAANEADEYDMGGRPQMFIACSSAGIESLLLENKVQSADYNVIKALVAGEVDSFMGFQFIRTEKVTVTSNVEEAIAFTRSALGLCIWEDIVARVTERPDKRYSQYIYYRMTIGATRLDGKKMVRLYIKNV